MHEYHAAQSIVDAAVKAAEKHGAKKVVSIEVKLGEQSMIEPSQIEYLVGSLAKGTLAEGAKVESKVVPGAAVIVGGLEVE